MMTENYISESARKHLAFQTFVFDLNEFLGLNIDKESKLSVEANFYKWPHSGEIRIVFSLPGIRETSFEFRNPIDFMPKMIEFNKELFLEYKSNNAYVTFHYK